MAAIEQQVFGIAKELSDKGNEVFIMRAWPGSLKMETISGVHLVNINLSTTQRGFHEDLAFMRIPLVLIEHLLFTLKAYRRIKVLNPDIISISNILTGYFVYLLGGTSKRVFITHDHDIYPGKGILSLVKRKMLQSIVRNSNSVIALNDDIKKYMRYLGFNVDIVIPNAIHLMNYEENNDSGFIMFAGRLVSHKKVEDLLQAYAELGCSFKEALVIIGDGPCRKELEQYAESLSLHEKVRFFSFLHRSQYRRFLSKCSVFAFPSMEEAFGVVLIEAMASGKPVVARNIIGPKGIVTHGYNGFLFNDITELIGYLKTLLSDKELRKKMGKNARKTVKDKYTFRKVAKKYLRLYEHLLGRG